MPSFDGVDSSKEKVEDPSAAAEEDEEMATRTFWIVVGGEEYLLTRSRARDTKREILVLACVGMVVGDEEEDGIVASCWAEDMLVSRVVAVVVAVVVGIVEEVLYAWGLRRFITSFQPQQGKVLQTNKQTFRLFVFGFVRVKRHRMQHSERRKKKTLLAATWKEKKQKKWTTGS